MDQDPVEGLGDGGDAGEPSKQRGTLFPELGRRAGCPGAQRSECVYMEGCRVLMGVGGEDGDQQSKGRQG
jgi:hypothetical protein